MKKITLPDTVLELEKKIKDSNFKRISHLLLSLAMGAICFTTAFFLHPLLVDFKLPIILFGSFFPAIGTFSFLENTNEKNEAIKRCHHMDKIQKEGIKTNSKLRQMRNDKVLELEDKQDNLRTPMILDDVFLVLGGMTWTLGAALSLFLPNLAWVSYIGIILSLVAGKGKIDDQKEFSKLQTRINNLLDDLELEDFYGYDSNKEKTTSKKISSSKGRAIPHPKYQEEVEKYVEQLDKENYDPESHKIKIKGVD